ncbi:MAG TPA: ROK family transcriptional regulator [Pilimelia sp.]|nr:ROK family transcriptional regulator [Pilimelia sp.]
MTLRSWRPHDIRAMHRGLLLRLLDEHGPMTRGELARRTGLSLPSISAVTADLAAMGCLAEAGRQSSGARRGRTGTVLRLARDSYVVAGVAIDVGRVRAGLCDLSTSIIVSAETAYRPDAAPAEVLDTAIAAARPLLRMAPAPLVGIGVAVPGSVDTTGRRNLDSYRLGWHDVPVADLVERELGAPTLVEYNVRAIALAESQRTPDGQNLLYLHVGTGVGLALVVDGQIVRHGVPELGHHPMAAGPPCACGGEGCLEALVALPYLQARVDAAALHSGTLAAALADGHPPLTALHAAGEAGDGRATAILTDYVCHLADGLAIAVNLLSPARVVLGGILGTAPETVLHRIQAGVRAKACRPLRDGLHIELSTLDTLPDVRGAAAVALNSFFYADGPDPGAPRRKVAARRR